MIADLNSSDFIDWITNSFYDTSVIIILSEWVKGDS